MDLGNYKIKVTTEAESKEVISPLIQLGYKAGKIDRLGFVCTDNGLIYAESMEHWDSYEGKILTLPQLRDFVVLHRNDVKDANYTGKYCGDFYVTSDGVIYGWNDIDAWERNSATTMDIIEPINQELISGKDALIALVNGKEVEYSFVGEWFVVGLKTELGIFHRTDVAFRLKPCTITLNIEIPATFEPKDGEMFFYLNGYSPNGFGCQYKTEGHSNYTQFGTWRTEEEIKQVVAALRGALKNG